MRGDDFKPAYDRCRLHDLTIEKLIENPKDAEELDTFNFGKRTKLTISAQQSPTPDRSQRIGERVGKRKLGVTSPDGLCHCDFIAGEFFDAQTACHELRPTKVR
jgi:hypothetical protein